MIGRRTGPAKVRKRHTGNVKKGNPHDGGFPFYSGSIWIREGKEKGIVLQESTHLKQGLELSNVDRFRYRTRYFTDSGIIGTKEFVSRVYQDFKGYFASTHEKRPKPVKETYGTLLTNVTKCGGPFVGDEIDDTKAVRLYAQTGQVRFSGCPAASCHVSWYRTPENFPRHSGQKEFCRSAGPSSDGDIHEFSCRVAQLFNVTAREILDPDKKP